MKFRIFSPQCLVLFITVFLHQTVGIKTEGLQDLQVISNQAPEAIIGTTITVHEGDRLTLTCLARGADPRRVFWYEGTSNLLAANRQNDDATFSATFTLDSVQATDDERTLTCWVDSSTQHQKMTIKVQKIKHRGFEMHVSSNPANALSSENIAEVTIGTQLELTCVLQGVAPHRVSWWHGKEQISESSEMDRYSATSSLTISPVVALDHRKTFTCRADGSTMTRAITLKVHGIPEEVNETREKASILEKIRTHPKLHLIVLSMVLFLSIILIITCILFIKTLQGYIRVSKKGSINDEEKTPQQKKMKASSSSSSNQGKKDPPMKRSLKNQILASRTLLSTNSGAPGAGEESPDLNDQTEIAPLHQHLKQEGRDNAAFVEEV